MEKQVEIVLKMPWNAPLDFLALITAHRFI